MLSNSDKLASLIEKHKITPVKVMLVFIAFHFIRNVILAVVYDAWYPTPGQIGLNQDISTWFIDLLLQPTIVSYFVWMQTAGDTVADSLVDEGVVKNDEEFRALRENWRGRLRSPWIFAASAAAGIVMTAVMVKGSEYGIGEELTRGWLGTHAMLRSLVGPMVGVYTALWILILLDIRALILSVDEILEKVEIDVQPLHPDNAGGLGALGRFSANLGFGVGMFGLAITVVVFQYPIFLSTSISFLVALTFYLILAPTILYLPVRSAHIKMLEYRNGFAGEISDDFDSKVLEIRNLYARGLDEIKPITERINLLREVNEWVMEFPVWPINTESLRKYVGFTLSPVVPALITVMVDIVLNIV